MFKYGVQQSCGGCGEGAKSFSKQQLQGRQVKLGCMRLEERNNKRGSGPSKGLSILGYAARR
jgi:hypothetical protein